VFTEKKIRNPKSEKSGEPETHFCANFAVLTIPLGAHSRFLDSNFEFSYG